MTTTWKYRFVDVAYHKDKWLVRWMNGSEVPDWKNSMEMTPATVLIHQGGTMTAEEFYHGDSKNDESHTQAIA